MAKKIEFDPALVKKYIFWIATPIGLVVALVACVMSIGSISQELETKKAELNTEMTSVKTLQSGAAAHPNQKTLDVIAEDQKKLTEDVLAAWSTMVEAQQERNLWTGLADRSIAEIKSKNFLDTLEGATLDNYLTFTRDEINKLLDRSNIMRVQQYQVMPNGQRVPIEKIDLTRGVSLGGGGGQSRSTTGGLSTTRNPADRNQQIVMAGKVIWDSPALDLTMKDWYGQRPQSFEVWMTQEDLWVYQALLWVVAESNKNFRGASKPVAVNSMGGSSASAAGDPLDLRGAVVKQIIDIAIGKQAAMQLIQQTSRRIGLTGMSGGGYGGSDMFGLDSSSGGYGTSSTMGSGDYSSTGLTVDTVALAEAAKQAALKGRYVDDAGQPLLVADLTGQYRRMPIFLEFVVDQRYIADVLVHCANCPMPIDVLWVTINPDASEGFDYVPTISQSNEGASGYTSSRGGTSSSGSMGRAGRSSGGGMGSSRPTIRAPGRGSTASSGSRSGSYGGTGTEVEIIGLPDRSGSSGGFASNVNATDFGPDAAIIQIYGCINIFAPPDASKLTGVSTTTVVSPY